MVVEFITTYAISFFHAFSVAADSSEKLMPIFL
jgi:hypothetical protein